MDSVYDSFVMQIFVFIFISMIITLLF